jgi:hypothetical protein
MRREVRAVVLMVSYDLNRHERPISYQAVHEAIKKNAISFKRPLYSQWFVETEGSVQAWSDLIAGVFDQDDSWFVVRVTSPYQGWLPAETWEWLAARV